MDDEEPEASKTLNKTLGLSSNEALRILSRSMRKELQRTKSSLETAESIWEWIKEGFLHSSPLSTFSWTSVVLVMAEVIVFVICFTKDCTERAFSLSRSHYLPLEGFILLIILFVNVYLVGWDAVQRQREMWFRAEHVLRIIDKCLQSDTDKNWKSAEYPHLFMPQSPCISLQWTYRDGQLVNLPLHLLVEGDVITMRPGHVAPGKCQSIVDMDDKIITLESGDFYVPPASETEASSINFQQQNHLKFRKPLSVDNFVMKETPYLAALKLCLKKSLDRPTTLFNRERHTIISCYLQKVAIPLVLLFSLTIEGLHVTYVSPQHCHWAESLVLRPALTLLPLLPLALPTCWFLLNVTGVAYLLAMMDVYSRAQLKKPLDSYNEVDEDSAPPSPRCVVRWRHLRPVLSQLLFSQGGHLWRSSNLLQVLGSVTTFCCIDKKGILSWPNPFPEKVFFLRSSNQEQETLGNNRNQTSNSNIHHFNPHQNIDSHRHSHLHHSHAGIASQGVSLEDNAYFSTPSLLNGYIEDSDGHLCVSQNDNLDAMCQRKGSRIRDPIYAQSGNRAEVLDLTHNVSNDFAVEFDDPKWKKHLNSLKPLGLSILVNTCNPAAQEYYSKFCDHITCESLSNDAAVPVVNKRCLCELAKQIGFTDSAIESYQLQELLAVFRHVQPDVVRKGRLAKSLNLSRLKMPFPYMSCAVIKDPHTGSHQLFSQGTGDLLIDTCSDFWNGKGLSTLSESDRKRILDFYHRSSLTAYCMAFSYAPLPRPPKPGLAEKYLELPPDSSHTLRHRLISESSGGASPSRNRGFNPDDHFPNEFFNGELMKPYLSTDSLLYLKELEEEAAHEACGKGKKAELTLLSDKLREDSFLDVLSHQIFIGMVTMQYQACPDIVQLIELLDKSCVRFVHFSKENELRSRVFSEKMGLESGWNCHISLLQRSRSESGGSNQQPNTSWTSVQESDFNNFQMTSSDLQIGDLKLNKLPVRCVSAPSLVNLETYTVRFEDEVSLYSSNPSECDMTIADQPYSVYFRDGDENFFAPDMGSELQPLNTNRNILEPPFARTIREESSNTRSNGNRRYSSTRLRGSTLSQSPSHVTESTDQSVPVTFDMSNRAKLPKGIENIRPHLDHVDNVPLLVSLFTDCTPEATQEMIKIMQDYGEVVACVGSSANVHNIPIFLQADVSVGMEPLFPQLCRDQPIFSSDPRSSKREFRTPNGSLRTKKEEEYLTKEELRMSPTELSRHLNLLPCCNGIHRDDPISLYHLVIEARHIASGMQNSLQFMLCCCLSLTLLQILATLFFLPAPLAPSHSIWLVCFQIPILSLSLVGNPCDPQGATMATGKNIKENIVSKQTFFFFLGCYFIKFCPSIIVTCVCFGVTVAYLCNIQILYGTQIVRGLGSATCWIFSPTETNVTSSETTSQEDLVWASSITISQNLVAFLILFYFVIISVGFVQRMHLLWDRNPFQNRYWAIACTFVMLFQLIFSVIDITAYAEGTKVLTLLEVIPYYIWILGFVWPLPLIVINALVKRYEIKVNIRQQKRVRLEFGTKLGMNSPF